MEFITDRQEIDIDYVESLKVKIAKNTATADERAEYIQSMMKGSYNYTDLNRVAQDVKDLRDIGVAGGLEIVFPTEPKTDWALNDKPTPAQLASYLENVGIIADAFEVDRSLLPASIVGLTIDGANTIETILYNTSLVEPVVRLIDDNSNYLVTENGEILTL